MTQEIRPEVKQAIDAVKGIELTAWEISLLLHSMDNPEMPGLCWVTNKLGPVSSEYAFVAGRLLGGTPQLPPDVEPVEPSDVEMPDWVRGNPEGALGV